MQSIVQACPCFRHILHVYIFIYIDLMAIEIDILEI